MNELLEEIDFLLMQLEDSAHGEEGRRITEIRNKITKAQNTKPITGEDVAALLHGIHTHAELTIPWELMKYIPDGEVKKYEKELGEIYYAEEDLLPVLEALGLPAPVWGKSMSVEEFKKQRS